ncbi:hypothetical protein ISH20_31530 [Pseudomonas aeruginosa]|uniref:hypothetical protein n=1 Tax=Pseudomonas aeruginosa TaxID=287 RepID=UPI001C9E1764|nr:hypothetical protein [Pseudomonas aeruginosa]MBY9591488.1 hypothetical protein [Pseudomonas aeruginosa]MBY9642618.1 hypothetical protein [Pseudomonas aeruginosa]MDU0698326.1 hypothetical protein [Pseudomonas aeruginosa]QZV46456.1 hypothetical protein KUU70_33350 [Pseudomonas aeruginosa]
MIFFRNKSLFHDVEREMLATIKKQAGMNYVLYRLFDIASKVGAVGVFTLLLCWMLLEFILQGFLGAGPTITKQYGDLLAPIIVGLGVLGVVAQIFYQVQLDKLLPLVRDAARSVNH